MSKPAAAPEDEQTTTPAAPPAFQRALLITTIVLGMLIVVGLCAVLARIIYLSSSSPSQPVAQFGAAADMASSALPFEALLSLPEGAIVRSTSMAGNRLAVHYESPNGAGIAIVDVVTGRTLGRLRSAPAALGR